MSYMIFRKRDCQLMLNINSFNAMLRFVTLTDHFLKQKREPDWVVAERRSKFGMSHSKAAAAAGLFAHCVFRVFGARRNRRRTNGRTNGLENCENEGIILCRCERAVYRGSRAIALKISPSCVNSFLLGRQLAAITDVSNFKDVKSESSSYLKGINLRASRKTLNGAAEYREKWPRRAADITQLAAVHNWLFPLAIASNNNSTGQQVTTYALAAQRANCPRCRVGFLRIRVERRMRWSAKGGDGSGNSTEPFCRAAQLPKKGKKFPYCKSDSRERNKKERREKKKGILNDLKLEQEKLRFCRPEVLWITMFNYGFTPKRQRTPRGYPSRCASSQALQLFSRSTALYPLLRHVSIGIRLYILFALTEQCPRVLEFQCVDAFQGESFRGEAQYINEISIILWCARRSLCYYIPHTYANWKGPLPNLRDFFRTEQIDWLLTEDVKNKNDNIYGGYPFIRFAARTGYKDEPEIDENGKPLLRRTTPIHNAARLRGSSFTIIRELFKIYDRFDVNYSDEFGYTHFHVVCRHGCYELVEKFLEAGQDPNLVVTKTGNSPLHLAVTRVDEDTVRVLLRNGADPNLANKDGLTPLHFICNTADEDEIFAELFFKISDQVGRPVQVDARDKLGRTPLQLAVSTFLPRVIDVLLDRGADVTSFVYPTESYFGVSWIIEKDRCNDFIIRLAFDALAILERLEERGYELDQSGALTIMKYFAKYGMFKMSADLDRCWYDDEQFAIQAKELEVSPSLSFYDLVRLRPEKANKLFIRAASQLPTALIPTYTRSRLAGVCSPAQMSKFFMIHETRRYDALHRVSTLISHRKTHSEQKPHKCYICNKGFHQKDNLITPIGSVSEYPLHTEDDFSLLEELISNEQAAEKVTGAPPVDQATDGELLEFAANEGIQFVRATEDGHYEVMTDGEARDLMTQNSHDFEILGTERTGSVDSVVEANQSINNVHEQPLIQPEIIIPDQADIMVLDPNNDQKALTLGDIEILEDKDLKQLLGTKYSQGQFDTNSNPLALLSQVKLNEILAMKPIDENSNNSFVDENMNSIIVPNEMPSILNDQNELLAIAPTAIHNKNFQLLEQPLVNSAIYRLIGDENSRDRRDAVHKSLRAYDASMCAMRFERYKYNATSSSSQGRGSKYPLKSADKIREGSHLDKILRHTYLWAYAKTRRVYIGHLLDVARSFTGDIFRKWLTGVFEVTRDHFLLTYQQVVHNR
ncbi:unnamed protein product, partial [Trichogramma brassicae]